MSNILSLANCANPDSIFNVGVPLCDIQRGKIKGIILLDRGTFFTPTHLASLVAFLAELKVKTTAARGGRAYPILDLLNFEDNTGDPATGSVGNLSTATIVTNDAVPAFLFGYNGTEARHTTMSLIAGMSLDVMFIDDKYAIYGTRSGDNFAGYTILQAYSHVAKFIVSDSVNQYAFRLTLGNIVQYREQSGYVVTNTGLLAIQGLINVSMNKFSSASNVWKFLPVSDGGTNLEPLFGTALAAATWVMTNLTDNSNVTVTSVAKDDTNKALTYTIDSTMYTAAPSGTQFLVTPPSPSVLAAAGVKPYEVISFIITKP